MEKCQNYVENSFITMIVSLVLIVTVVLVSARIFCCLTMGWNKSNVCLLGKTVLITGGNSGLGFQTALILAGRGARIILADKNDCTESKQQIIAQTNNSNVIAKFVDLADLGSIRRFAKEIDETEPRLDVLINNAGVAGTFPGYTKDGLQVQMQINHLGPFLLTHLLVDLLKKSSPSRIVFVSSAMGFSTHSVDRLNDDQSTGIGYYDQCLLYSKSKLCNAIASIGFAEKLKGTGVTCNALHPGLVRTPIITSAMSIYGMKHSEHFFSFILYIFGKNAYEGAQTHAYLAMADEVKDVTGKFFADCRFWVQPWKTNDKAYCDAVWKKCEELVKLEPRERLLNNRNGFV